MSIKVMSAVWELSRHHGSDLLLLLAIADHADDEGVAYPAIPRLARKARMTERGVQKCLARLKRSRELGIQPNSGPKRANLYRVNVVRGSISLEVSEKQDDSIKGTQTYPEHCSGVNVVRGEQRDTLDGEPQFTQTIIRTVSKKENSLPTVESYPGGVNSVHAPGSPSGVAEVALPPLHTRKAPKAPPPLSEEDWPGLRRILEEFGLPLAFLDDNDWWNDLSYTCNNPTNQWLAQEFAKIHRWLNEHPKQRPTKRWKTFVGGWLERAYEQQRKGGRYATQKPRRG